MYNFSCFIDDRKSVVLNSNFRVLGSRLEDTLRFLTLWFKHGDQVEVFGTIKESLKLLPVEMWLEV